MMILLILLYMFITSICIACVVVGSQSEKRMERQREQRRELVEEFKKEYSDK